MAHGTMKQLLMGKQMRKIQEALHSGNALTYDDLKRICPKDLERAEVLTAMLTGGMIKASFYPIPLSETEAPHG